MDREEEERPPLPPRRSRGPEAVAKKRSQGSGYGRGSMSSPGLRAKELRKEKSSGQEKRLNSTASGGLGIKGPSPRMATPRSASASERRYQQAPASLPVLRQEA